MSIYTKWDIPCVLMSGLDLVSNALLLSILSIYAIFFPNPISIKLHWVGKAFVFKTDIDREWRRIYMEDCLEDFFFPDGKNWELCWVSKLVLKFSEFGSTLIDATPLLKTNTLLFDVAFWNHSHGYFPFLSFPLMNIYYHFLFARYSR